MIKLVGMGVNAVDSIDEKTNINTEINFRTQIQQNVGKET